MSFISCIRAVRPAVQTFTGCSTSSCAPVAVAGAQACQTRNFWKDVPMGPADPIMGITDGFNKCTDPRKLNLGVGAYRDDNGKPFVLPSVKLAEAKLLSSGLAHEYAPITGLADFNDLGLKLLYGEGSAPLDEKRVAYGQCLSGTGGLRVFAHFIKNHYPGNKTCYQPKPTWANHIPIFKDAGCDVQSYKYYDPKTCGLDFEGMCSDIEAMPNGSVVMLHACAHNPTGVDPTPEQWTELSALFKRKGHLPFFDSAYQGFASGSPATDAFSVRKFVEDGHLVTVVQSFAKNFGLYGERAGIISMVCADPDEAKRVDSQLKIVIRPMYSNPPLHGARIVKTILSDPELNKQWLGDVDTMASRIINMRTALRSELEGLGSSRPWNHVTDQIGMFCFSGLTPEQCDTLRTDYHIYMTRNGRISMAGVTSKSVGYLAEAMHAVTK